MSYKSMAEEENRCDFPSCVREFDRREGVRNAFEKGKTIMAFCEAHSQRLLKEGVLLRPLRDIHMERTLTKEVPERERLQREQEARERAFIESLKS